MPTDLTVPNATILARDFHDFYEQLAPAYGYETRVDTRSFDPTTPNGRLMIAVCQKIMDRYSRRIQGE